MEYLFSLYIHVGNKEGFKCHPHCRDNKMTHLIIADDLIVFSAAESKTLSYLMEAFDKFSKCTGLEANKEKSQIVLRVSRTTKEEDTGANRVSRGEAPI